MMHCHAVKKVRNQPWLSSTVPVDRPQSPAHAPAAAGPAGQRRQTRSGTGSSHRS